MRQALSAVTPVVRSTHSEHLQSIVRMRRRARDAAARSRTTSSTPPVQFRAQSSIYASWVTERGSVNLSRSRTS
eukprot:3252778-Pyramimonas_sp.AAC.1